MLRKLHTLVSKAKGFTLIELLIVIAIIAILTVAFLPTALKAPAKARDAQRQKAVNDIVAALESYMTEKDGALPVGNNMSNIGYCLVYVSSATPASGLDVLGTYFANNTFPQDPKPVMVTTTTTTNLCGSDNAALKSAYYYRRFAGTTINTAPYYYVVGAMPEVAVSGNTSLAYADLTAGATTIDAVKSATSKNAGGIAPTEPTPNAATPYFLRIGPR